MIFLFQPLPFLLPLNQTFPCHKGSVPIIINDTSQVRDVKDVNKKGDPPSPLNQMRFRRYSILNNYNKFKSNELTKFA